MENALVSDPKRGTYERVHQRVARRIFEQGAMLYVMTDDRDPIRSLTTAHEYRKGCARWYGSSEHGPIESFNDVLEDFAEWLDCDGYGHMPDHYKARYCRFSFWIKIC